MHILYITLNDFDQQILVKSLFEEIFFVRDQSLNKC